VASIRHWYPSIPISLVKDGDYNTSNLENYWGVEIFTTVGKRFGPGWSRLEALFNPTRERCLIVDSDIVLAGPILDALEQYDEDFIVEGGDYPAEDIKDFYYDPELVCTLSPSFRYPGYVFNAGQIIATTGILKQEDFTPFVAFEEPRRILRPDLFEAFDQGVLNFVLHQKAQEGALSVRRHRYMRWPGELQSCEVDIERLKARDGYGFLLHWAGFKHPVLRDNFMGHVLNYFERSYFQKTIPLMTRDPALTC
jgi:hypothetical protein